MDWIVVIVLTILMECTDNHFYTGAAVLCNALTPLSWVHHPFVSDSERKRSNEGWKQSTHYGVVDKFSSEQ